MRKLKDIKPALVKLRLLIKNNCFTSKKTKNNYLTLINSKNKTLFNLLDQAGFFEFHISNNKFIVGLHQIVAYIYKGYRSYINGYTVEKGYIEIHHLDSNPRNNHITNLVYVSTQEHLLISQASLNYTTTIVKSCEPCPFNSKGEPVSDALKRLSYLVYTTIKRTFSSIGVSTNISVFNVLCEIPQVYTLKRINWTPSFLKKIIKELNKNLYI